VDTEQPRSDSIHFRKLSIVSKIEILKHDFSGIFLFHLINITGTEAEKNAYTI